MRIDQLALHLGLLHQVTVFRRLFHQVSCVFPADPEYKTAIGTV